MGAPAAVRIRHDLQTRLVRSRAATDEIFSLIREEALYDRPIAERHRLIFYLGHVEAFDWNLLGRRAFGCVPLIRLSISFLHLALIQLVAASPPTARWTGHSQRSGPLQRPPPR